MASRSSSSRRWHLVRSRWMRRSSAWRSSSRCAASRASAAASDTGAAVAGGVPRATRPGMVGGMVCSEGSTWNLMAPPLRLGFAKEIWHGTGHATGHGAMGGGGVGHTSSPWAIAWVLPRLRDALPRHPKGGSATF